MNDRPDGLHELICVECGLAYAALNPPYAEIERPVCPSCREFPRLAKTEKEN